MAVQADVHPFRDLHLAFHALSRYGVYGFLRRLRQFGADGDEPRGNGGLFHDVPDSVADTLQ